MGGDISEIKAITVSIISHILWGFHPVCARYLQTRPKVPLDGVNLLAVAQIIAFCINILSSFASKSHSDDDNNEDDRDKKDKDDTEPMLPKKDTTLVDIESNTASLKSETDESDPVKSFQWTDPKTIRVMITYGTLAAIRATSNMYSTKFTYAYNIQLISMASPMITAIVSSIILHELLPWTLWPCLFFTGCGEGIVLLAQAGILQMNNNVTYESLTYNDIFGISLQFVSLFFSAFARVMMVTTKKLFTPSQLMGVQYMFTSIPILFWSTFYNPKESWEPWLHLDKKGYIIFIFFVIGIFKYAAEFQVLAIRLLGPGGHVAYQPIRLASTLFGSYIILNEKVKNPIEIIGLFIVFITLVWYLAYGKTCGLKTDMTGKKYSSALLASKEKRWWFQVLCWPRPSRRIPPSKVKEKNISSNSNNNNSNNRIKASHEQRNTTTSSSKEEIRQNRRNKMRQARDSKTPKKVKMLREDNGSEDSSEDSDDDARLLGRAVDKSLLLKKKVQRKRQRASSTTRKEAR